MGKPKPPAPTPTPSTYIPKVPRDLWVWQSGVASDPAQKAAFFEWAKRHAVRNVYIESQGLIVNNQAALQNFIVEAAAHGIGVYLLYAYHPWALEVNHVDAVKYAQLSAQFVQKVTALQLTAPLGVHYDVEPHVLDEWGADRGNIMQQYVSMIQKIKAALGPIQLMMCIPFWYDYSLTRGTVTKTLDQWVLTYADSVAIMDFRNTAARIVPGMEIIDRAQAVGKKALVGLLIEQDTDYTYTSFYSYFIPSATNGETYMDKQMADSEALFRADANKVQAYAGFVIEDYAWYKKVSP